MSGIDRITKERKRQIEVEMWTSEHDDQHANEELARAAACYILVGRASSAKDSSVFRAWWPWHEDWWKPSKNHIRNLEKAGALIAAEIDRLERAEETP